jgi:hypothetical protein
MADPPNVKMFCPYCQRPVTRHEKPGDDVDHRWCFIHLHDAKLITNEGTPKDAAESFYALCAAHVPRKAKPRKVKISREQRTTTVPGTVYP